MEKMEKSNYQLGWNWRQWHGWNAFMYFVARDIFKLEIPVLECIVAVVVVVGLLESHILFSQEKSNMSKWPLWAYLFTFKCNPFLLELWLVGKLVNVPDYSVV